MYVDFRMATETLAKDVVGPIGGSGDNVVCWQIGKDVEDKEDLKVLVDQMWTAIERKQHELQGSVQTTGS